MMAKTHETEIQAPSDTLVPNVESKIMTKTCNVAPPVICVEFAAGYGCFDNRQGVNHNQWSNL